MDNNENFQNAEPQMQLELPNSSGVLVMGILSIVCFCCLAAGIIGITLGILAVVLGNKALKEYAQQPDKYSLKSYKNAKSGRVCGIIGLSFGGLWIIAVIILLSVIGWTFSSIFTAVPWDMLGN